MSSHTFSVTDIFAKKSVIIVSTQQQPVSATGKDDDREATINCKRTQRHCYSDRDR